MVQRKTRTSINLSRQVLADIRTSGVRNISKYFEDLARAELYNVKNLTAQESSLLKNLSAELEGWREEWQQYLKEEEREHKGAKP
jgi:hypothetical protein